MAEVINLPADSFDRLQDSAGKDNQDKSPAAVDDKRSVEEEAKQSGSPPPPPSPDNRRRERDSREKRDERDFARPPDRQGGYHYDRNRMPPPPPRDRERDYKRRLSPSPPPHRDRWPSSPSRRSPPFPSYKRSRRDDGYDGRRGSPKGYGNERRFRYDHTRAHDYDMGFRHGYGDDRFYRRLFGGYPGGPDWDSGHDGSKGMSRSAIPREGLMSYKQFIQELEDDILPSEAERRYEEYKSEYIIAQKRTYFQAHKDEEWLRNKYHPTNLVSVIERRNEHARNVAKGFLLDLHSGELDLGPSANSASKDKSERINEPNFENEVEGCAKRRHHGQSSKESETFAAPMAPSVSSDPKRIKIDIEFALALVSKLDSEKGIGENILSRPDNEKTSRDKPHGGSVGPVVIVRGSTSVKGLEGVELLDTLLTYLWRVHGVDYYGMVEVAEPKGLRHVRPEGKSSSSTSSIADEWQKKLDSYWQERLRNQDPLEIMTAKEKIDAAAVEGLNPYVRKIRDEKYGWKYGCGAKGCTKLFHGPEFVQKHLKLKHTDLVMELTSKVREDIYLQNYMNDPKAPGGQPVMQQAVKEKPPRRGPFDGRLKDDRGILRDRDGRGSFCERIDRSENTQGVDYPGKNDDQNNGIKADDEPTFDNFGGPGVCIPPFAQDGPPPPVMIPVPGAGPLGPFIPAPPEVAMRMMREQGGAPSTCEGAGRKGRLIAGGRGGPPIILPPNYKPDPRRLRSYNDLDAPEDEVTVIDYRSI